MKKRLYILLIFVCLFWSVNVTAASCSNVTESSVKTYFATNGYSGAKYCSGDRTLENSGSFPLTIASILKSYNMNYIPTDVSKYLCEHYQGMIASSNYSTIVKANDVEDEFKVNIDRIENTMTAIDETLANKKSVLASINSSSIFADNASFIGIVMKKNDQYYIINTASQDEDNTSGWYSKDSLEENVLNAIDTGMWSIFPKDCDNSSASIVTPVAQTEEDHSPSEDPYPGAGPNLGTDDEVKCNKIFKKNGSDEFNDLGQFLQNVFLGIRLLAPALVIILSTIDYIKAIASSNQDDLKKVNKKTIKRVVAGLIIFFIPLLLDILFKLFGIYDLSTCGIGS